MISRIAFDWYYQRDDDIWLDTYEAPLGTVLVPRGSWEPPSVEPVLISRYFWRDVYGNTTIWEVDETEPHRRYARWLTTEE